VRGGGRGYQPFLEKEKSYCTRLSDNKPEPAQTLCFKPRRALYYVGKVRKMPTPLDDMMRKAREEANILAEEARVLQEISDDHARAAHERAKKATERSRKLTERLRELTERFGKLLEAEKKRSTR
jgi:hypothetical protein